LSSIAGRRLEMQRLQQYSFHSRITAESPPNMAHASECAAIVCRRVARSCPLRCDAEPNSALADTFLKMVERLFDLIDEYQTLVARIEHFQSAVNGDELPPNLFDMGGALRTL